MFDSCSAYLVVKVHLAAGCGLLMTAISSRRSLATAIAQVPLASHTRVLLHTDPERRSNRFENG